MTMPAIRAMRRNFKGYHLSLLVKPWVLPLFEKDPNIDELLEYKDSYTGISGKVQLTRLLRKEDFSMAFLFQNAFDAAMITFLAGIRERIGYARDRRGFLLTKPIPVTGKTLRFHHIDYYLNLLGKAGIGADHKLPWIYLEVEERMKARKSFSHLERPVIGINPGAAYGSAKRWPSVRFARIIERIMGDLKGSALLFGSQKETEIATDIINHIEPDLLEEDKLLNLTGKTTIRELCALISECDLLLANDSGPMHIGYAVGTPLVALFGSTDPLLTGPPDFDDDSESGFKKIIFKKEIECSPCFHRTCPYGHLECMDKITHEEVYDAIVKLVPENKAIFFDRDGTLCKDANYLNRLEDLDIFPEVKGLKGIKEKGYKLVGISNQSGIARGIVDKSFVKKVNRIFIEQYGFDDFFYCPHHPDEHCACRKPEPGLLYKARAEHDVDLRNSFFVGDKDSDMVTAESAGATPVFLTSEKGKVTATSIRRIRSLDELGEIV